MARKCLSLKVLAFNIETFFYLFVKGPIDANNITDITPSEATKMPKYRTVSSSDQPNWSIHNGVPSLKKKEGFPKEVFFHQMHFVFAHYRILEQVLISLPISKPFCNIVPLPFYNYFYSVQSKSFQRRAIIKEKLVNIKFGKVSTEKKKNSKEATYVSTRIKLKT